jgi:sarcosine oxidase, subunit gamma
MMYQYHPPVGRALATHDKPLLIVRAAADAARFNLRIDPKQLDAASKEYGLNLPRMIGGMMSSGARTAVCLGPDEWYLVAPLSEEESIERGFATLYATIIHSLVNVGHRETGIEISGAGAAFALQSAIAFDVEAMPVGSGCRTLIDKAQIILLREAANRFRIEVWHSFADHVWHLLQTISREIELGI